MNPEIRSCQNCKQQFAIEPEDFGFYEKIQVPFPTFCPQCRFQRRLSFMNERVLHKNICKMCGKNIVCMYPSGSPVTVYCNTCWWSDKWDGTQYGIEYDSSRPFFSQLKELIEKVPQVTLEVNYPTLVNSDYINHAATSKNCYLIYTAD